MSHSSSSIPLVGPPMYIPWQQTIMRWVGGGIGVCDCIRDFRLEAEILGREGYMRAEGKGRLYQSAWPGNASTSCVGEIEK